MDGPLFFRLAHRVGAYGGVISMRAEKEAEKRGPARSEVKRVHSSAAALKMSSLGHYTEFAKAPAKKDGV
jgi:hypothetical protein